MGLFDKLFNEPDPKPDASSIRDTLYGDQALDAWPRVEMAADQFPWTSFVAARRHLGTGEIELAKTCWQQVIAAPGLESRHYAQAWYFLRQNGVQPPNESAKTVLGVVVEVGMPKGLDLLAAYPDHYARYYNFSGAGVIWEHPNSSLDPIIDELIVASSQVVLKIGPWDKERPGPVPTGLMRLSFLTPSGFHFGQAPINTLAADPLASPVVRIAGQLMQALIAKTK
jgi:hypothetical protein